MMHTPNIVPRSSKYGNNYWSSLGPKVGMREVTLYSDLEFDHWVRVETSPGVETYCEQYPKISYVFNGELHTSIFDMWVQMKNGTVKCCEVKYESELNPENPRNSRTLKQIEAQKIWCDNNGILHEIVTDKDLRKNHLELENRLKIISVVKNNAQPKCTEEIIKILTSERLSLKTLTEQSNIPFKDIHDACIWLFYRGIIDVNIDECIISMQTVVRLNESSESF
ncbi:TnsA endonuclease N-terminal domain-containing protein [Paenibacillus ottowii]